MSRFTDRRDSGEVRDARVRPGAWGGCADLGRLVGFLSLMAEKSTN